VARWLSAAERQPFVRATTARPTSPDVRHESARPRARAKRCDDELIFEIDPGIGGWEPRKRWQDTIWAAPFIGLVEFVSDLRHGRLTTADWIFLIVVVTLR
jgi:hypothetical protein